MNLTYGDTIEIQAEGKVHRSKVSKVDGKVIKLLEENGTYRQMAAKDLEKMIAKGFAVVKKHGL